MRIRRFSRPQLVPIRQSNGAEPPCDAKDRHQAAEERDTKGEAADRKEQEDNNTRYYSEWRTDQRKDDDNERDDDDKKARRTKRDDEMLIWMFATKTREAYSAFKGTPIQATATTPLACGNKAVECLES